MNNEVLVKDLTSFGFQQKGYSRNPDEVVIYQKQKNGTLKKLSAKSYKDQHFKRIADGTADADDVKKALQDIHTNKINHFRTSFSSIKHYLTSNQETELVRESVAQHKYAKFMNNSYEYYSKKPIKPTKGFRVDESLSSLKAKVRDNLVLVNNVEKEVVISFRGTTNSYDWVNNAKLGMNKFRGTARYKNADKLVQDTLEKYPDYKLVLTAHSQGGNLSMDLGQKYDLESHNFDAAISFQQVAEQPRYYNNVERTFIYRPSIGDAVSINSWCSPIRNNPKVIIQQVNTLPETSTIVDHHSSELFNPEPEGTHPSGDYLVRRNTLKTSLKKFVGRSTEVAGYGLLAYDVGKDVTSKQSTAGKSFDVGRDVGSFVAGGIVGEVVAGGLVAAAAPEALVIGGAIATGVVVGVAINYMSDSIKPEVLTDVKESINRRNEGYGLGQGSSSNSSLNRFAKRVENAFDFIPKFQL